MTQLSDYSAEVEDTTPEQLAAVVNLARRVHRKRGDVERARLQLEREEEELRLLVEEELPGAMQKANVTVQPLGNGWTARLETSVLSASLHAEPKTAEDILAHEKRIKWLEDHGQEDLVKREVRVYFDRKDLGWFKKFVQDMRKRKRPLKSALRNYVHSQTWRSFLREVVKDPDFPRDLFGVYERKVVVLVPPQED